MIEIWKTIAMGVVEGLTEFLPISSTGHMILVGAWIDFPKDLEKTFEIFIQVGAIFAVVLYFRQRLMDWVRSFDMQKPLDHPIAKVLVAFLPCAVVGLATHHWIEENLMTPFNVALALIFGGIAIAVVEATHKHPKTLMVEKMTLEQAFFIGILQCLALFPGVSRSAATIMGGLVVGMSLPAAAEFSFFLAIPTVSAASVYSLLKVYKTLSMVYVTQLAVGAGVAFVVALIVVAAFMRYIQTNSFMPFVIYRIALGSAVLARIFKLF